jgi:hypothetical protein
MPSHKEEGEQAEARTCSPHCPRATIKKLDKQSTFDDNFVFELGSI